MQEIDTGKMIPIDRELHEQYERLRKERLRKEVGESTEHDAPPPSFQLGEVIEIKGGRFKVQSIRRGGLVLKGLPRQAIQEGR